MMYVERKEIRAGGKKNKMIGCKIATSLRSERPSEDLFRSSYDYSLTHCVVLDVEENDVKRYDVDDIEAIDVEKYDV